MLWQFGVVGYDGPVMQIEKLAEVSGVDPLQLTVLVTCSAPSLRVLVTVAVPWPPSVGTVADVSPDLDHSVPRPDSVMV